MNKTRTEETMYYIFFIISVLSQTSLLYVTIVTDMKLHTHEHTHSRASEYTQACTHEHAHTETCI